MAGRVSEMALRLRYGQNLESIFSRRRSLPWLKRPDPSAPPRTGLPKPEFSLSDGFIITICRKSGDVAGEVAVQVTG